MLKKKIQEIKININYKRDNYNYNYNNTINYSTRPMNNQFNIMKENYIVLWMIFSEILSQKEK